MPTEKPQFSIVMDNETLEKVEDFRYENRFPNRSQAINHLIKKGLEAEKQEQEQKQDKNG